MTSNDRIYFSKRAGEEKQAARSTNNRQARIRHEELAWLYQMRVDYIDRGLADDSADGSKDQEPVQAPRPFLAA
jgi:hypothetical protein